jgi:hypothetical protein
MVDSFKKVAGSGKYIVEAVTVRCGNDLNVTIGGGEKYHIGAVAIAVPRFEYKEGKKRSASTSVICVQGHREDELSYNSAKYLATELNCTVVVTIGIHVDEIKADEFNTLMENFDKLLKSIVDYYNNKQE